MTDYLQRRFWSRTIVRDDGCWDWTGSTNAGGYGQVSVNRRPILAHRVAWLLSHFIIPEGKWVLHRCDRRPCVNPDHLFLGTRTDNMLDMRSKGRQSQGTRFPQSRLTPELIVSMRAMHAAGESTANIGRSMGVAQSTVSRALSGRTWRQAQ